MKYFSSDDESKDGYEEIKPLMSTENSSLGSSHNSIFDDHEDGRYNSVSAFLIFFFPALGGLLFGYDIGATSAVLTQLKDSGTSGVTWTVTVSDSSLLQGLITSIGMFGALLGSLTCFKIADGLGRRRTLIIASILFTVGATIEYFSGRSTLSASTGIGLLLLGRIVYGYACGFAMHGAPAYIGEMAPPQIRGVLVSLKEVFIVLGMLLGYTIGYSYSSRVGGWRVTYFWAVAPAVIMLYGMWNLPYSARWLALQGRISEAKDSMRFVIPELPSTEVESLRELALQSSMRRAENRPESLFEDIRRFRAPNIYPALVAGIGLVIFQQISGQPSVLYYADSLFEDVGMDLSASILIAAWKLIATSIATFTVDKYGRKTLLLWGCSLMFVALVILTIAFIFPYTPAETCNAYTSSDSCPSSDGCTWLSSCESTCLLSGEADNECTCCAASFDFHKDVLLFALFLYIGGYQIGFGPISWLMISEIFPIEVRGKAVSMAVVMNFFWNTIMTLLFPVELEYLGSSITFLIYTFIICLALYFIYRNVPETKGMTLEEIEAYFVATSGGKRRSGDNDDGEQLPNKREEISNSMPATSAPSASSANDRVFTGLVGRPVGDDYSYQNPFAENSNHDLQHRLETPRSPPVARRSSQSSQNSYHSVSSSSRSESFYEHGNLDPESNEHLLGSTITIGTGLQPPQMPSSSASSVSSSSSSTKKTHEDLRALL
jgi:sugar porter (SP) family MFS transporter